MSLNLKRSLVLVGWAALWVYLSWGSSAIPAMGLDGPVRLFAEATLEKRLQETVVFVTDRDGRSCEIKALLSDRTVVLDEQKRRIRLEDQGPGSIWTIYLEYPQAAEGTPIIVKMQRVRARLPE